MRDTPPFSEKSKKRRCTNSSQVLTRFTIVQLSNGFAIKFLFCLLGCLCAMTSMSLGQGSAPLAPQRIFWDARSSGLKPSDSIADQSSALNAAADKACQLGRPLFVPSGTYNAALTLDSSNDNLVIVLGDSVRIKRVWHLTGNGPDLDPADSNYSLSDGFVENVRVVGTLTLASGGRLGTFYARNVHIDNIIGEDSCIGVHIYSHSEEITTNNIFVRGTKQDGAVTGGVWIDRYSTAGESSVPKNINIGSLHVARAHYNGLYVEGKNVTVGSLIVDTAGLCGLRVLGTFSENIRIGSAIIKKCGGNPVTPTAEHIHSGISIDNSAKRVSIGNAVISHSFERALAISSGVNTVHIQSLVCDSNAINDSGISYHVYIDGSATRDIAIGEALISNARVSDSSYGMAINGAQDVRIGDVTVRNGFRVGFQAAGATRQLRVGSIHCYKDTIGVQIGSSSNGQYSFDEIATDSCQRYGVYLVSQTDSSHFRFGSIVSSGDMAQSSSAGIYFENVNGNVGIDRAVAKNYGASNARGLLVAGNNTGRIHIGYLLCRKNVTGIYWDTTANDNFSFGQIDFDGNTTQNYTTTGANAFRTDPKLYFSILNDSLYFGRYGVAMTTPANGQVWKFDGSDSTWKPQADAGAGSGDNVAVDTTTSAGGTVDITNPVLQEGSNVSMTIVGTDTVRISASGGGSAQFIKTVDTNSAGTTTIQPDSIHVNDSGGINIDGKIVVGIDTVTISLADGGVTAIKMAPNAVAGGTGGVITDNSITAADIAAGGCGSSEVGTSAVSGGVGGQITDATVTNDDVADDNLNATSIAPDGVDASELKAASKLAGKFYVSSTKGDTTIADTAAATIGYVNRQIDNSGNEIRYISSCYAYGTLVPPTDSITLSLPVRSGNVHFLFSDSTNQGNDTDRVDCEISVPYDFDLDSISLAYITSSATADSSQVDSCEVWGPNRLNGTNAADSNWHQENVAYAGTLLTRVAFAIDESINAGDRFAVRFKNVLKQDASFVRVAWVQFVGKER